MGKGTNIHFLYNTLCTLQSPRSQHRASYIYSPLNIVDLHWNPVRAMVLVLDGHHNINVMQRPIQWFISFMTASRVRRSHCSSWIQSSSLLSSSNRISIGRVHGNIAQRCYTQYDVLCVLPISIAIRRHSSFVIRRCIWFITRSPIKHLVISVNVRIRITEHSVIELMERYHITSALNGRTEKNRVSAVSIQIAPLPNQVHHSAFPEKTEISTN